MKKLSCEEIKNKIFTATNGEYTTDGIVDKDGKCLITHTCGYSWRAIPKTVWRGISHCPKCSRNLILIDDLKSILNKMNLELITPILTEIKQRDKIQVKCKKCGKIFDVFISNLLTKYRKKCDYYCLTCERNNQKLLKLQSDPDINKDFNIISVDGDYAICVCKKCGKESRKYIYEFKKSGCKFCANNVKKTTEEIKEKVNDITNNEYEVLSEYSNSHSKLLIKHNVCGKIFEMNTINFVSGNHRCPFCSSSLFQQDVYDYVKKICPDAINNDRTTLKNENLELDVYIPSKKVAIECNGLYWHSENVKGKESQVEKLHICSQKGIRLITLFEDEYEQSKDLVFNKIAHVLGVDNSQKIYARKCIVKEISNNDKNDFLNKYHIQGTCCSSINIGLFYNDNLVAVMTFAKPRCGIGKNKNRENKIELTRFATNNNYRVIGGFSKIISFVKENYSFEEIYSYGDLRWVDINNNVYIKNGFALSHINPPNYWYFYNKTRLHRFGFRKDALKKKFPTLYDKNLTEFQIMDKTKYKRIWDCGTAVFSLSLS